MQRLSVLTLVCCLMIAGCGGKALPIDHANPPVATTPNTAVPDNSARQPTQVGQFATCDVPIRPNACVQWHVTAPFTPGSIRVSTEPSVPTKVLIGKDAIYVLPDPFWPACRTVVRVVAVSVAGKPLSLPEGVIDVPAYQDGRAVLTRALQKLGEASYVQMQYCTGYGRAPRLLWTDKAWLTDCSYSLQSARGATFILSVPDRFLGVQSNGPGNANRQYTVLLGDRQWHWTVDTGHFIPSTAPSTWLLDPQKWEPVNSLAKLSRVVTAGEEIVDGKAVQVLALGAQPVPGLQGVHATGGVLWVDKGSGLPQSLLLLDASYDDSGPDLVGFLTRGQLAQFSYSEKPTLPPNIQEFIRQQGR